MHYTKDKHFELSAYLVGQKKCMSKIQYKCKYIDDYRSIKLRKKNFDFETSNVILSNF